MNIEDLYINSSFFSSADSRDREYFLSISEACAEENIRVGLLANSEDEKDLEFCREVLKDSKFKEDFEFHLNFFLGIFVCKPSEGVKQKADFIKSQALPLHPHQKTLTFVYDKDVREIADILALDENSQTLIVANNAQIIQPDGAAASLEMFRSFCERISRQEKDSVVTDGASLPAASVAVNDVQGVVGFRRAKIDLV